MAARTLPKAPGRKQPFSGKWLLIALLGGALLVLFRQSFIPGQILFDNDTTLGFFKEECNQMPGRFAGTWRDLSWLGGQAPAASPDITYALLTLFSPLVFLKIYAPLTLFFLGFSAWVFFRQLEFNPAVCVLGGLAAALNGHFFSVACWGQGSWEIAAGCAFLAMAAFYSKAIPKVWQRAVLAGLAVGLMVMEGFDVGAILSVFIGLFILFRSFNDDAPMSRRIFNAIVAEMLVVLFGVAIAAHTMFTLVRTQVEGVASMGQDAETKHTRWRSATQWSLPKVETLQIFVPGLFGYRLSGNSAQIDRSGAYWGLIGQDPRIAALGSDDPVVRSNTVAALNLPYEEYGAPLDTPDRHSRIDAMVKVTKKSGIYWRYTGSGECAGTVVTLLALFGLANFFRKDAVFSKAERISVGCWGAVALFCLLTSWGRFGFVYQFLYKLPYVSTIRNPIKFMHPFHIAWVILAAYGLEVLYRRYMRKPDTRSGLLPHHLLEWWPKAANFERRWTIFMLGFVAVAVVGTLALYTHRAALIQYLGDQNFTMLVRSPKPTQVADFCLKQVFWFDAFLGAGVLVLAALISGAWCGARSKWGWGILGALMLCDLWRASVPWVRYYDYVEKYALNPVTEFLCNKPWEHRIIGKLEPRGPGSGIQQGLGALYFFWLQNDFCYHNLQSLDYSQMSHIPDLDRTYLEAFQLTGIDMRTADLRPAVRLWQLTNTRYIMALANALELLNGRVDPIHHSFRILGSFDLVLKPSIEQAVDMGDYTVSPNREGSYVLIEYPRTLPRAKLFANWRTSASDAATLGLLTSQDFEPLNTVLIAKDTPAPTPQSDSTADAGEVTITDHHPKYVRLEADAKTPAVLLLNDRTGEDWRAQIDGKDAPVLRCNYIMRGVYMTPGRHVIEFRFKPSLMSLYASTAAIVVTLILAGYLAISLAFAKKPEIAAPAENKPESPIAPKPSPALAKQRGNGKKGGRS